MAISTLFTSRRTHAVLSCALLSACTGGGTEEELPYCNPTANAGENLSIDLSSTVDLDGSESGYGENCMVQSLNYEWSFESVPVDSATDDTSLTDNNTASAVTTSFIPDVPGTYVIALVVCDYLECSDADLAVVTVSAGDAAPVADAGPPQMGKVDARIELDGSASYDPENSEISYLWTLSTQPSCSALDEGSMYAPNSANAAFIPDCEGIYTASLVVSDGVQWSDPDYTTITVSNEDLPPVADAGESSSVPPCDGDKVELNGNGSYDPEGQPLEFAWSLMTAPADSVATDADFSDATAATPQFQWDITGAYTFQLQVSDGTYWSAPDIVTYTVLSESDNTKPQANAGENQAADLEADCESSSYTWSCEDCRAVEFDLDASSSYDADGDELSYTWTDLSGALVMTGTTTPFATATTPSMPATYDSTSNASYDVGLEISDCLWNDDDTLRIEISCKGTSN